MTLNGVKAITYRLNSDFTPLIYNMSRFPWMRQVVPCCGESHRLRGAYVPAEILHAAWPDLVIFRQQYMRI